MCMQGTSNKAASCSTCFAKMSDCPGHFAHIQLQLPVFHIGYFKAIIQLLQNICKVRGSPLPRLRSQPFLGSRHTHRRRDRYHRHAAGP